MIPNEVESVSQKAALAHAATRRGEMPVMSLRPLGYMKAPLGGITQESYEEGGSHTYRGPSR